MSKIVIVKYLLSNKGGIETRFHNYLNEFLSRGFQIEVIYGSCEKNYHFLDDVDYKRISLGFTPTRNLRKIRFAKRVAIQRKKQLDNNIVISMGRTGGSDITIAAGNYDGASKQKVKGSNWYRQRLYYLDRLSFDHSSLIIAASDMVRQSIINLFDVNENKIKVVHPPVDHLKFQRLPKEEIMEIQREYRIDPTRFNFLFVSTSHQRKGLAFLRKIFKKLGPQYQLFAIGKPIGFEEDNMRYLGHVERTWEIYNAVDYLIHPANYEAFGQVVPEAILCGTKAIISSNVGAKEIMSSSYGTVIDSLNPNEWVSQIQKLDKRYLDLDTAPLIKQLNIGSHIDALLNHWKRHCQMEAEHGKK